MKKIIFILFLFTALGCTAQSIYICRSGETTFFSKAPLEDIEAVNKNTTSLLNTATSDIVFTVPMKAFKFKKDLMREHFNEKYVESDKFPDATFKGKINEKVDFTKDGIYKVTATGKLKIHGVEKDRTEKGTLVIKGKEINLHTELEVLVKDFNIEIPQLVFEKVSEKIDVKLDATYVPYK